MIIRGGISKTNYEKTLSIIKEIIQKYQDGIISCDALEVTKKGVITAIKSDLDTFSSIYNSAIACAINGKIRSTKDKIDMINALTIEDIQRASSSLVLDTVYLMKGNK